MLSFDEDSKEIWVSIGVTKNLGNYESLKLDAGGKVTIAPGGDKDQAWRDLWAEVEAQIEKQLDDAGLS